MLTALNEASKFSSLNTFICHKLFVFSIVTYVSVELHFCPCSGHDYGVFIMVFVDLLYIEGGILCFSQIDMRQLHEKCLADLFIGQIRNFPM